MRLARRQGIQILGPVAVIIRNAETVADAVDGVSRFLHNLTPDHIELIRGPRAAVFTLTTAVRQLAPHDQWVEKGLGIALDAFRLMLGEDFVPLRVTMQHRRIAPLKSYRDMFGCPVEFQSERTPCICPSARSLSRSAAGRGGTGFSGEVPLRDRTRSCGGRPRPGSDPAPPGGEPGQSGRGCSGDVPAPRSSSAGSPSPAPVRGDPRRRAPGDGVGAVCDRDAGRRDSHPARVLRAEQLLTSVPTLVRRVAEAVARASKRPDGRDSCLTAERTTRAA